MQRLINTIFRTYIALARGERFSPSELGDRLVFTTRTGETVFEIPTVQRNWIENESLKTEICADLNISDKEYFDLGIIEKPSEVANVLYCAELHRIYGLETIRKIDGFDLHGHLRLPRYASALIPVRQNKLMTGFEVWKPKQKLRAA